MQGDDAYVETGRTPVRQEMLDNIQSQDQSYVESSPGGEEGYDGQPYVEVGQLNQYTQR